MAIDKRFLILLASLLLASPVVAGEDAAPPAAESAAETPAKPVEQPAASITPEAPKPAPAISWIDAGGAPQTLEPERAKLTILHFWATWCIPCLKELPELDRIAAGWHDRGVRVVALALDGANVQHIRDFYDAHQVTHLTPNYDINNAGLRAMRGSALPLSVFINAKGEMIGRAEGPVDWKADATKQFLEGAVK